jgi:glycosyltransferase involved in cell wall biosynthesis
MSLLGPRLDTYGPGQRLKWSRGAFGLFQSEALLAEARDRVGADLPQRVAVAPVGVDIDSMRRSREYLPWDQSGPLKIYSCGRLNRVKGHEDVIAAIGILRDRGLDARLRIAGEDEYGGSGYRRVLEDLVKRRRLGGVVTFLGAVSEETNRNEYCDAHVYVMGSLDEAAGAVAAMEAMSLQVPVIMTRVGATEELIETGVDGLLVEKQQPEKLAEAIARVAHDPGLAVKLGRAGRRKIERKFHHKRSALQIAEFLRSTGTA